MIILAFRWYFVVSVPLRGSGNGTVEKDALSQNTWVDTFPSPCGEVEMERLYVHTSGDDYNGQKVSVPLRGSGNGTFVDDPIDA